MYCVCAKNYFPSCIFHPPHPWYSIVLMLIFFPIVFLCVFDGLLGLFPAFIIYAVCFRLNPKAKNLCMHMNIIFSEWTGYLLFFRLLIFLFFNKIMFLLLCFYKLDT